MDSCKLTICFEDPFWIALIEREEGDSYQVARHVFGPEPTDPQVEEFIRDNWKRLRFSPQLHIEKQGGRRINYKRMRRIIEKELAANARKGTKAQQALAEMREESAMEKKTMSKAQREAEKELRYEQRVAKRKQKHRGH